MGKRILLVEGTDDQHVMWNLFDVRKVPERFKVLMPNEDYESAHKDDYAPEQKAAEGGGVEALLMAVPTRLKEADLECLAVVLDADDKGPAARWGAIRKRLVRAGYQSIPEAYCGQGAVFEVSLRPQTPRSVRFGAWVMPDNHSPGMLEDFVAQMIRQQDSMLPRVDQFLTSIPRDERRFSEAHWSKARLRTWLAVSELPGRPMGQAIKADEYIDARHPSVQPFLDWIQKALVD